MWEEDDDANRKLGDVASIGEDSSLAVYNRALNDIRYYMEKVAVFRQVIGKQYLS